MARLYLVDDHAIVREGLRAVLEAAGMTVVGESDNVVQAMADISRLVPDVLLLDLGLGARSGLDLLAQLQGLELPTRVLVLTVSERPRDVSEALRMGASGYVLKGSSGRDLVQAIHDVLEGRRHIADSVAGSLRDDSSVGTADDPMALLSDRERQIMRMVVGGQSSAAIAAELNLSPKTVDTYRSRLMAKLGVHEVTGLVRLAVRMGIIDSGRE